MDDVIELVIEFVVEGFMAMIDRIRKKRKKHKHKNPKNRETNTSANKRE